jgi:hypothetical protein
MKRLLIPVLLGLGAALAVVLGLVAFGVLGRASSAVAPAASAAAAARAHASNPLRNVRRSAHMVANISALQRLPKMSQAETATLSAQFADLTIGSYQVDPATARQAADGIYLARRGDGLACLIARSGSMCPSAMMDGGIAFLPSSGHEGGAQDGAWLLTVEGVALDGVGNVEFEFRDGSSALASVQNNVFALEVRGQRSEDIQGYKIDGRTYPLP